MAAPTLSKPDEDFRVHLTGRLEAMRSVRETWKAHWRELADYFLPRRYKWIVTANNNSRGSQLNQRILDSSGVLAARNLASGLMSGKVSPSQPWLKLKVNQIDSTGTTPVSLWLGECERLMRLVFQESNFYPSIAQYLFDLVIFGTASLIIYHDYDDVINCYNPCAGEFFVDLDQRFRPTILYREFTMTVAAIVKEFGEDNCPEDVVQMYKDAGANLTKEYIIAHAIEPNDDNRKFGIASTFDFREVYWIYGNIQGGVEFCGFLRKTGYHEQPHSTVRWDIVSNDPYGRSAAMDALPDQKQLQLATKRKAQAIDKMVNPPLVADARLKNQPASQLPGGITYVEGFAATGKPSLASIFSSEFPVGELVKDLEEVRERLKYTFYNHLFQPISQFETRSNITAVEINQRKSESLIMLGPVFERLDNEGLRPIVERVFGIMSRAGVFPPPPPEIAGQDMNIEFVSMLALAQDAANSAAIQQVLGLVGNVIGVDPELGDAVDFDVAINLFSSLLNNDPRMMRSADDVAKRRADRAAQQQQAARAQQAQQLAQSAGNLAKAPESGSPLERMMGGPQG